MFGEPQQYAELPPLLFLCIPSEQPPERRPILPTGPSTLPFLTWALHVFVEAQFSQLFFTLNFHSKLVRHRTFMMPTFFAASRIVLYVDS